MVPKATRQLVTDLHVSLFLGVPCLRCTHRPSNSLVIFSYSDRDERSTISGHLLSATGHTHERGAEVAIYENGKPVCEPQQLHTCRHGFIDFIDGMNMKHISETLSNALKWQMSRKFLVRLQFTTRAASRFDVFTEVDLISTCL